MCQRDNPLFGTNFKYCDANSSSNVNGSVRMRTKKMIDLKEKLQTTLILQYSVYGINIANLMRKLNHSCL